MKWVGIPGLEESYQVTRSGLIRSIDRELVVKRGDSTYKIKLKGKNIKVCKNKSGYFRISVTINGRKVSGLVHRFVALTFLPNLGNKPEVNHKNARKTDNRVRNLEWVTKLENLQHAMKLGLLYKGEQVHLSKLTKQGILTICSMIDTSNATFREIARCFSIQEAAVASINLGRTWNHITHRKGKRKIFNHRGPNSPKARAVMNCRGEIFETSRAAAKAFDLKPCSISNCIHGRLRSAGAYPDTKGVVRWYFAEEYRENLTRSVIADAK